MHTVTHFTFEDPTHTITHFKFDHALREARFYAGGELLVTARYDTLEELYGRAASLTLTALREDDTLEAKEAASLLEVNLMAFTRMPVRREGYTLCVGGKRARVAFARDTGHYRLYVEGRRVLADHDLDMFTRQALTWLTAF